MNMKRAPLLGAIGYILLIIFIMTTVVYATSITTKDKIEISNPTKTEQIIEEKVETEEDIPQPQTTDTTSQTKQQSITSAPDVVTQTTSEDFYLIGLTSETSNYINLGTFKISAYCHCSKCCGKSDGITASGVRAVEGVTVAADTKTLPLGTKIYIGGVGERIVQDRGGAIKGNKIDLYFSSHQAAINWGIQYRDVSLIKQ